MGLLARLESAKLHASYSPDADFWYQPVYSGVTASGVRMTPDAAMTLSAIWRAVRIYQRTIGSMPCITYRKLAAGGKERASQHPLYDLLRWQPNAWQTAFDFWGMALGHLKLRGNFYAEILAGPRGFADQLIPRHPDRMTPELLPSGTMRYKWRQVNGTEIIYSQDEIFHLRGPSSDGIVGMSMIQAGAASLGGAVAADGFAHRFFSQGASPAFAAIHPGPLGAVGMKNLRESIQSYTSGLANAHTPLILEEGMTIAQLGIKPEDAQLVATREFNIDDVARWTDLPASMLGNAKTPTFASQESFRIELVIFSLTPECIAIEQAIRRDLILGVDTYFSEFLLENLLRGDSAARAAFYREAILNGWMSRNEVRERENLNPEDGLDTFLEPLNMMPVGTPRSTPVAPPAPTRANLIVHEAAARLVRKEVARAQWAAKKYAHDPEGWKVSIRDFYEEHATTVAQVLRLQIARAREYTVSQELALQQQGIGAAEDWEREMPAHLMAIALEEVP